MDNIKQTTNYDMFKVCDWNRGIKKSNLKRIDASVQVNGWLKHPIMVNEKMEVIDGQHRLAYAKEHNLPVYYVEIRGLALEDCLTMNNTRMSWSLYDFIESYATQEKADYAIVKELAQKYTFVPISVLIALIKGQSSTGGVTRIVKSGKLEIAEDEYKRALKKLEFLRECAPQILSVPGRASSMFLATAFAYDLPAIDRNRLQSQIKRWIGIVVPPANIEMAVKELENLYNYRGSREDYVYIYTEWKKAAFNRMTSNLTGVIARDKNK